MSIKNRPCAYCGRIDIPRERGHVIPNCMYPSDTDPRIQRPTVAECMECKKTWQDAENQFRNILNIGGTPNRPVREQWEGPIHRSFEKPSGFLWLQKLLDQMVRVDSSDGPRYMVYPANDPEVMLVIRKIIRGLCVYHRIATVIRDAQVWADVLRYSIPSELKDQLTWNHLGKAFFEYGFELFDDEKTNLHSAWYLKFYEEREFVGMISITDAVIQDKT